MCSCGCMLKSARILICQQRQSTFIFIYFLFKTHSSCLALVPAATSGTLLNFLILSVCFSCSLPTFLRNCTTSCHFYLFFCSLIHRVPHFTAAWSNYLQFHPDLGQQHHPSTSRVLAMTLFTPSQPLDLVAVCLRPGRRTDNHVWNDD